jgi:uncharacterized protein (DUF58 family)
VEGFISGLHRSSHQGFSVEFAEHREYYPGDEIRYIDWKVWGRTDKLHIKTYEEDTNLKAYLVFDISRSMSFGSGEISKLQYGKLLSASLAYLILKQRDAIGLAGYHHEVAYFVPARGKMAHLHHLVEKLEATEAVGKTNIAPVFHYLAERLKRRGLIIVISDLFDQPVNVLSGLKHLRHKKHEIIVFHLLDKDELEFPYTGSVKFVDLESGQTLLTEGEEIKKLYLKQIEDFCQRYQQECQANLIDYVRINTATPLEQSLFSFLLKRKKFS